MPILNAVVRRQRALPASALEAVKTWRYLRLAMIVVVAGLAASVLYEHTQAAKGCWQTSLSGYYYTPVHSVFVGALVAIGVGLIALKGNTDWEDLLLNLAGACAPVVAFVPYSHPGTCGSVLTDTAERNADVANNVVGLLTAGGVALLLLGGLTLAGHWNGTSRTGRIGFGVIVVLYLATALAFALARPQFTAYGHTVAAIAMFAFVYANVWLNAVNLYFSDHRRVVNRYAVIGLLMTAAIVATIALALTHWPYAVLGIETGLTLLFALFWALQTTELWNHGLRHALRDPSAPRRPSAADRLATAPRGGGS